MPSPPPQTLKDPVDVESVPFLQTQIFFFTGVSLVFPLEIHQDSTRVMGSKKLLGIENELGKFTPHFHLTKCYADSRSELAQPIIQS